MTTLPTEKGHTSQVVHYRSAEGSTYSIFVCWRRRLLQHVKTFVSYLDHMFCDALQDKDLALKYTQDSKKAATIYII